MAFFKAEDVSIAFGGLRALNGVGFNVNQGEIFSIIGPNGAGKTTIFNCINRFYDLEEGAFYLKDQNISRIKPHDVADRERLAGTSRAHAEAMLFGGGEPIERKPVRSTQR